MSAGRKSGETVDTVMALEGDYAGKTGKNSGIRKGWGNGA
jgi:hypothetical protein